MEDSTVGGTGMGAAIDGDKGDGRSEALRRLPALRRLTDREVANVARTVENVQVEPGHVLVREGEPGRDAYVIAEGVARVTVAGEHLCDVEPGEIVGELATLDGRPRTATVTAVTPMTLLALDPSCFYCFGGLPPVAIAVLKSLSDRLRAADARLAERAADRAGAESMAVGGAAAQDS